jgi:23S rRNA (cytosine1962-C5)-methyltransferase
MILYEDPHLLVVHKPAGINTHKPDPLAPDGIHEWLSRPGRTLAIHQRLDKATSGVLLFGKTTRANQSLTRQFTEHRLEKEYLLLTAQKPTRRLVRAYSPGAETFFDYLEPVRDWHLLRARPTTGKTHQIRKHAAGAGFPIVGDDEYGGVPAPRLMLHAHRLTLRHPVTHEKVTFTASVPAVFADGDPVTAAREFRELLFDETDTNAYRLINGAGDALPGLVVDSYAGNLLVQRLWPGTVVPELPGECVYEQLATKHQRSAPQCVRGAPVAGRFAVRENGVNYLINFGEGLSTGIFLDQRENRRRLLQMPLAGKRVLNCFAYTCAFSVVAAQAGAVTTSVDLSRNYLEWGRENFRANGLNVADHEFPAADVLAWLPGAARRGRAWDVVVLDPPTFATTKAGRRFQAGRDYGELVALALPVVARGGRLLCSTNQRTLAATDFELAIRRAADAAGREIRGLEFVTLPWDYRLAPPERPYLKTWWVRLE